MAVVELQEYQKNADLSEQTLLNHPHERGSSILEAERHGDITEAPEWSDETVLISSGPYRRI